MDTGFRRHDGVVRSEVYFEGRCCKRFRRTRNAVDTLTRERCRCGRIVFVNIFCIYNVEMDHLGAAVRSIEARLAFPPKFKTYRSALPPRVQAGR